MKCISEELIQKYIDNETSDKEVVYINNHLSVCVKCAEKIEKYRESASNIKQLVNLLDEKEIKIPEFKKPVLQKKMINPKLKKIIYFSAAACILIFFLILSQKQKNDVEIIYSYDLESEYNANLPLSEQEMVIEIIDSKGKLIKY